MDTWRTDWTQRKCEIAHRLENGEAGGSYGDAVIILCSTISALAANAWPGERIDRARFVELLKNFAPTGFDSTVISIPLLIEDLNKGGRDEGNIIKREFCDYSPAQVLVGTEVDKTEKDILGFCNTLTLKYIRDHSYANLLYSEVRCPYTHEFKPGKRADSGPLTRRENVGISYGNWIDEYEKHIHYPLDWISNIAISIAQDLDKMSDSLPLAQPHNWWIRG